MPSAPCLSAPARYDGGRAFLTFFCGECFVPCPLRVLSACCVILSLTGCLATSRMPSEAELIRMARDIPSEADLKERFRAVGGVLREICTADEFAPYYDKTPCLASQMSKKHLADKSKITTKQAKAMQNALVELDNLNTETRRMMTASQLEPYVTLARDADQITDALARINQQKLLSGTITWGEYNRERARIAQLLTQERGAMKSATADEGDDAPAGKPQQRIDERDVQSLLK